VSTKKIKTPEEKPRPRRFLIYVGLRPYIKSGLAHTYLAVGEDWESHDIPEIDKADDDKVLCWTKALGKWIRVGTVFTVEHHDDEPGRVFVKTDEKVGSVPKEIAARWESVSRAYESEKTIERESKKDGARDITMELLDPLTRAYSELRNKNERTMLLGRIMAYVTRGSRL